MDRRTLLLCAVAALTVLAISVSAGTLLSTESTGGPGGGFGDNVTDTGLFEPEEIEEEPAEESSETDLPRGLQLLLTALTALVVLAAIVYMLLYRPMQLLTIVTFAVALLVLFWVLDAVDLSGSLGLPGESGFFSEGESQSGEQEAAEDGTVPPLPVLLSVLFGIGLLVALFAYINPRGARERVVAAVDPRSNRTEPEPEVGTEAAAIGRIAGEAADRIASEGAEQNAATNHVYRAWQEMTARLDVEGPETTTPGEFQAAAVDAGMGADDVRELTRLFEEVRYGGQRPTPDREDRALAVLRRIESRYGEPE